jgi:hypothetical protein
MKLKSDGFNLDVNVEKYTAIAFGLVGVLALYYRTRYKMLKKKLGKLGD